MATRTMRRAPEIVRRRRVLVAAGDAACRLVCDRILSREDFEVREAVDGRAALAVAAEWTPDVLLADLQLRDAADALLVRLFRQRHPTTAVVCLAGAGAAIGRPPGAAAVLPKATTTLDDLVRAVEGAARAA